MSLNAKPNDPWIGVHVMTEFLYCPRAGVLAHEHQIDDDAEDDSDAPANLDYLPLYDLRAIERRLPELRRQLQSVCIRRYIISGIIICVATMLALTILDDKWGIPPFAVVVVMFLAVLFLGTFSNRAVILRRNIDRLEGARSAATDASPTELPLHFDENHPTNWWQLLKAGFESITYKDSLRDEAWRLAGRPWRVLRRGQVRIPVFRKRTGDQPNAQRLFRQHYARMAAYCNLLERVEGAKSPYGIILFGDTYDGVAIPRDTSGAWSALSIGLNNARHYVRANSAPTGVFGVPAHERACHSCHHGKPFVHRRGETEHSRLGVQLPIYGSVGVDGRTYHSACGDRFTWTPPHQKAFDKELDD